MSRDPIGEKGGLALYAFVKNNPTSRFDLFGLTEFSNAQAEFEKNGTFSLKLTAKTGQKCTLVNFIQFVTQHVVSQRQVNGDLELVLDPGVKGVYYAPLYYDKSKGKGVPLTAQPRPSPETEMSFADKPTQPIWNEGDDFYFTLLIVDAFNDHADVLGAVVWGFYPVNNSGKLEIRSFFRPGTQQEAQQAVSQLAGNKFRPFQNAPPGYKIELDPGKFKALPNLKDTNFEFNKDPVR